MFRTVDDFIKVGEEERRSTLQILNALSQDSLSQAITPQNRSIGRLAWHIAACNPGMAVEAGLQVEGDLPSYESLPPQLLSEVVATYDRVSAAGLAAIRAQWSDAMLDEETPMYGESWKRGTTLLCMLLHEAHHRGQITVLMRQAGLKVPGVYGPALEEWEQYGMATPAGA